MKDEPQELRELLSRLPDAPVPSNFTARVMQAVEREEMQAGADLRLAMELAFVAAARRRRGGGGCCRRD